LLYDHLPAADYPSNHTSRLLEKGEDEIVKKIGEEAVPAATAGDQRIPRSAADLTFTHWCQFAGICPKGDAGRAVTKP
jgi:phosphoribosyl-ATP pyrophosphohydrolase